MDYEVRYTRQDEWPPLEDFLYEAIWVPEGFGDEVPRSVVYEDPKCRAAFEGFGTLPDDRAVVAEVGGKVVGACWVRTTDEYGHIDDATPSFSISVFEPYRGQNIGTAMMRAMLNELRDAGYGRASLSVQKENPALRLYERLGFRIIGDGADETEWLMVADLARDGVRTAVPGDVEAIHAVVQKSILDAYPPCYGRAEVAAFCRLHDVESIAADVGRGRVRVVSASDRIVGTGTLDGDHITRVFVLPEEQGKGYGTRMMDALERAAQPYGTAVLDTSIPAKALYLHRGYRATGTETWCVEPHDCFPAFRLNYETMEKNLNCEKEDVLIQ